MIELVGIRLIHSGVTTNRLLQQLLLYMLLLLLLLLLLLPYMLLLLLLSLLQMLMLLLLLQKLLLLMLLFLHKAVFLSKMNWCLGLWSCGWWESWSLLLLVSTSSRRHLLILTCRCSATCRYEL